jgi:hypothetical protein
MARAFDAAAHKSAKGNEASGFLGEGCRGAKPKRQTPVSGRNDPAPTTADPCCVLQFLNILQAILYVPLLSLLGQGALFILAGGRHRDNFFYKLLVTLASPFTFVVRKLTPKSLSDAQVGFITFMLVAVCSFMVFAERGYLMCVELGHADCRR